MDDQVAEATVFVVIEFTGNTAEVDGATIQRVCRTRAAAVTAADQLAAERQVPRAWIEVQEHVIKD